MKARRAALVLFVLFTGINTLRAVQPGPAPLSSRGSALRVPASRVRSTNQLAVARQAEAAGFQVQWDERRGIPRLVRGDDLGRVGAYSRGRGLRVQGRGDFARDAVAVVDNLAGLYGVQEAARELSARVVQQDARGRRHVRLVQRHQGLRVLGGELITHFDAKGRAYEVNGTYVPEVAVSTVPGWTLDQAQQQAAAWLTAHRWSAGDAQPGGELVVLARVSPARLAWQLGRTVLRPDGVAARWLFWVDAQDGAVLNAFDNTHHIDPPTAVGSPAAISGQVLAGEGGGTAVVTGWLETANSRYYLHNTNLAWQIYNVAASGSYPDLNTYAHRASNDWASSDTAAFSAAVGFEATQRYYLNVHGLHSFNDLGLLARGNVHEGTSYVNAYWNGTDFHFGDGDGATANALTVLDVVGHEYTHAVTEYSANLVYQNEPGALNESFSDVMGACVEFYAQADDRASYPSRHAGQSDWLMGEDCWLSSTALRDMRNPANIATVGAGNEQPTRYLGTYWYSGTGDNGGVHYNSGVQNFFFYLLCEGGTGTNDGIVYSLTGIGVTQAQYIAYQALTAYCTPDTDYRAARAAWLSAALDYQSALASNVALAWNAVGVGALSILPATGVSMVGEVGGPFAPTQQVLVITNLDTSVLGWGVTHTQSWLQVAPDHGAVDPFSAQSVTVTLTAAAASLGVGTQVDTLSFTNTSSAVIDQRTVTLTITPPVVYTFPLDTDPGWTTEGDWAWGVPTGGGSFNHDPTSGHTGNEVYGYQLNGDYTNNMPRYYLTSGALDCSGLTQVQVSFWRWLGVEPAVWDGAVFQASLDGVTWSNFWEHTGDTIADTAWTRQSIDLNGWADGQPTLYLRWGMGPSDGIITYPGWNLDDISVHGLAADDMRVTPGGGLVAQGYFGGPFSPTSQAYVIRNAATNGQSLTWSAGSSSAWVLVSPTGGTLAAGASVTSVVQLTALAATLAPAVHPFAVSFSNATSGFVSTRASQLTVREPLALTPAGNLQSAGYVGGPFAPTATVYVVTNRAAHAVGWGVAHTQAWVSVSTTGGLLAAGEAVSVTVSLNAGAESLGAGTYEDILVFTNADTAATELRAVYLQALASARLQVAPSLLHVTNAMGTVSTSLLSVANGAEADANLNFQAQAREVGAVATAGGASLAAAPEPEVVKLVPGHAFDAGELLVRFEQGLSGEQQTAVLQDLGGAEARRAYKLVPGLALVRLVPGQTVEQMLPVYNGHAGIRYAQPNYRHQATAVTPNDPRFSELWGLHNTGQTGGTPDADIDAPEAWEYGTGDTNVVVAIVDTGIDYLHEDLASNMWVNAGEIPGNLVDDDGNGYVDDVHGINAITGSGDPMDDHNHGTHCAGTIGGQGHNALGVAGVNWRVRLMGCKFLDSSGSGSTADAITCIEYAAQMGAQVLNNSWGGGPFEQALQDAIAAAGATGSIFVAAAGNDAMNTDVTANYPSCYTSANVLAVMAVDHNDVRSDFSNYGAQTVDVGAPGSSILSCRRGGGYLTMSGTSMATPHAAGACALLLAAHPGLTPEALRQILMDTADPTLPGQCVSGGRINLARAIAAVQAGWLDVQPKSGAGVLPGEASPVAVIFSAVERAAGVYTGEVVVTGNDLVQPVVRVPALLTVLEDNLRIQPDVTFTSRGEMGGPFSPTSQVYVVSNAGLSAVTWTLSQTAAWINVSSTGGTLAPASATSVVVSISASATGLAQGVWSARLAFTNTANGVAQLRAARLTVDPVAYDHFTQLFSTDNDLDQSMLTFTPRPGPPYYDVCRSNGVLAFATDPAGGINLALDDDGAAEITLTNQLGVPIFGQLRTNLFVGSNGYLTFGAGNDTYSESLTDHFLMERISALFDDLDPTSGGTISWKQLADRVAVTWSGVPEYNAASGNSFQVELFSNGVLRLTWLELAATDGLAGLSEGLGLPVDFVASDLSAYDVCPAVAPVLLVVTNPTELVTVNASQSTYRITGFADTNILAGQLRWSNEWSGAVGSTLLETSWAADAVPLAEGTNFIRLTATNDPRISLLAADHGTNTVYDDGWTDGDNGGFGWAGGWALTSFNGSAQAFITTVDPGNLSAGPRAWTLSASNGATAEVGRPLGASMTVGQTLRFRFDNNWITNGSSVGFGVQNAARNNLFEFMFIGGASTYVINDSTNGRTTSIPWSGDGWDVSFSVDAAGHYVLTCGVHVVAGQLSAQADQVPARFKLWNYSAGPTWQHNLYLNDLRQFSARPASISTSVVTVIVRPESDTDNDGMDDAWEQANGLSVGADDALGNPDGDAWLNWQEFIADTPAQVSNQVLRVQILPGTNGVNVVAGPATTNSRRYDVQISTNLLQPDWQVLQTNLTGASNGGALLVPVTNAGPSRAMRIDVHLP